MKNLKKILTIGGMTALFAGSFSASNLLWSDSETVDFSYVAGGSHTSLTVQSSASPDHHQIGDQRRGMYFQDKLITEDELRVLAEKRGLIKLYSVDARAVGATSISGSFSSTMTFSGEILKDSKQKLFTVDDPSECSIGSESQKNAKEYAIATDQYGRPTRNHTVNQFDMGIGDSRIANPNSERSILLCYTAVLPDSIGQEGEHRNVATVTANDPDTEEVVSSSDSWSASVKPKSVDYTEENIKSQVEDVSFKYSQSMSISLWSSGSRIYEKSHPWSDPSATYPVLNPEVQP